MKFKYKEQNKNGQIIEGIKESSDKFAVAKEIRDNGGTPLVIEQYKGGKQAVGKSSHISSPRLIVLSHPPGLALVLSCPTLAGMRRDVARSSWRLLGEVPWGKNGWVLFVITGRRETLRLGLMLYWMRAILLFVL